MIIVAKFAIAIILGYLIGSIPFGVLLGRLRLGIDVRSYGSGKMGATNVLRTLGKKAAVLVATLDLCKGVIAVLAAGLIVGNDYLFVGQVGLSAIVIQVMAGIAAIAGHNWPVFLKFKGGRGVATFFGALVALCPVAALFGGEILIIGAGVTKFASFGSIAGAVGAYSILVPLTIWHGFPLAVLFYSLAGVIIILAMHRGNIARLLAGKERRLDEKVEIEPPPKD